MAGLSWILLLLVTVISSSLTANVPSTTSSYVTATDRSRFLKRVESALMQTDLSNLHYSVVVYKLLNEPIKRIPEICEVLIKSAGDPSITTEKIYYLAHTWKILEKCQPKSLPLDALTKNLLAVLDKDGSTPEQLHHATSSLLAFGQKIPESTTTKLAKNLQAMLKKDENLLNVGYIFHTAADLGSAGAFAFNHIEDVIVQADEVNARHLQFEGGLSVTSLLVNGVFKLSTSLKKKPPLTPLQTVKLANYFLSRRSVQTHKGVANLLSSINILATNPFEKPICITLAEQGIAISAKQPLVHVKVCDLLGNPVPSVSNVVAESATKVGDSASIVKQKNFQSKSDKTIYVLDLMSASPEPGFYNIAVNVGQLSNTVTVKVLTEVKVDFLEIGTADADQTTPPKLVKVAHPQKLNQKIEADSQQKLVVRFALKDASKNKALRVHQAFVRLSSVTSSEKDQIEIIFVAEPDASHVYKFDMPVGTAAKNFGYQNGDYHVELIVGDAVLSNSFKWNLATVSLKFPESSGSEVVEKSGYKQKPNVYAPKPEIRHMFREPEKRPPAFVSDLFSLLCASPLLLLLVLWKIIGVNVSNFPFSLSAILFHLGLGSIFVLFGVFWLKLNMFTTLQYLLGLGLVTFFSGNKLLSQIARNRKLSSR